MASNARRGRNSDEHTEQFRYNIELKDFIEAYYKKRKNKKTIIPFKLMDEKKAMIDLESLMASISSQVNYTRNDLLSMPIPNFHALVLRLSKSKN